MKKLIWIVAVFFSVSIIAQNDTEEIYNYGNVDEFPIIVGCQESEDKKQCLDAALLEILSNYSFNCSCVGRQQVLFSYIINSNGKIVDISFRGNSAEEIRIYPNNDIPEIKEVEEKTIEDFSSVKEWQDYLFSPQRLENIGKTSNFISKMNIILSDLIDVSKPAQLNGENVSMRYVFPISFNF